MSDSTRLTGTLTFSRPLRWREYRDLAAKLNSESDPSVLQLTETSTEVDTDDGPMTRRTAHGAHPREIHGYCYGRGAETALRQIVEATLTISNDIHVQGYLYRVSDGGTAMERIYCLYRDRQLPAWEIVVEAALTVWPDGTSAYVPTQLNHGWFYQPGNGDPLFAEPAIATLGDLMEAARRAGVRDHQAAAVDAIVRGS